jgi:hypothetical protein
LQTNIKFEQIVSARRPLPIIIIIRMEGAMTRGGEEARIGKIKKAAVSPRASNSNSNSRNVYIKIFGRQKPQYNSKRSEHNKNNKLSNERGNLFESLIGNRLFPSSTSSAFSFSITIIISLVSHPKTDEHNITF